MHYIGLNGNRRVVLQRHPVCIQYAVQSCVLFFRKNYHVLFEHHVTLLYTQNGNSSNRTETQRTVNNNFKSMIYVVLKVVRGPSG